MNDPVVTANQIRSFKNAVAMNRKHGILWFSYWAACAESFGLPPFDLDACSCLRDAIHYWSHQP